jgi:putative ABC transport system permease protein
VDILDVVFMSGEGVKERKFRFALNLLGILIGCAAVTGLVSLTQGMNASITDQLGVMGADTLMILPADENSDLRMNPQSALNPTEGLTWRDRDIIAETPGVEKVVELSNQYASFTHRGEDYRVNVMGAGNYFLDINTGLEIDQGRMFNRNDKGAAVLGSNIAQPVNEDEPLVKLGDRITLKTLDGTSEMTFRVVGIAKETGGIMGINVDDMIAIPIKTCEQLFDTGGEYTLIQAKVGDLNDSELVAAKIENRLEDVFVVSPETAINAMKEVTATIESVLGGIASISLLVAGVGIINTMTVSVMERTREIGTMKAIGAKNLDVLVLFLSEATITGIIGGTIGASFGFMLSRIVSNMIGLRTEPTITLGAMVVGFAVVTSILSGLYPAWRASNLSPVEALRHE